ncbi:MAG: MBL fold metallo-hydrolase [Dehalococcoidia bacterium]|nr:MBL fold metallo-hydrolase [Dehalococcoidia bacterium]MSQ16734.1 MBL fold metallo-hydrolase [Dehalococcoidia bacterium]
MPHVHVTFLGTGAGQCVYRAHTAIVLDWDDGTRVLLDASSGNSALRHGAQLGMLAQDFNQVLLSHHHGDHMGGLPYIQGQRNSTNPGGPPLQVYGTEESMSSVQRLFQATNARQRVDQDGLHTASGHRAALWHPTQPGQWVPLSPQVRARAFPVNHIAGAVGWRVESGGLAVVFSGDTRFSPSLVEAAQGAQLLIHEAISTHRDKEDADRRAHSTASDAARAAAEAGVSQLVLTHIDSKYHFNPQPLVEEARRSYSGPVGVACDLYQVSVTGG